MSDQADAGSPPEPRSRLSPEQEARITRLLAQARHDEPMPADVAARLDGVLADLAWDGADAPAAVVDLATRRRRRNAGRLLIAAAAVIVAGVGVGQFVGTGSDDTAADAGGGSTAPDRSSSARGPEAGDDSAGGSAAQAPAPAATALPEALARALPLQLSSADLQADLQSQLGTLFAVTAPQDQSEDQSEGQGLLQAAPGFTCAAPPDASAATGELVPAYVDGAPVVLALQPVEGGSRRVDVVDCATGATTSSVTVQSP